MNTKRWILRTPDVLENCVNGLKKLPDTEIWEVVAKPYKLNRSLEQNDLMWTLLTLIGDHTGHTKAEMYNVTTELFLTPDLTEYRGKTYRRYSTSKLKIGEMSEFIDRIYQLAAEEGLYIPARLEAA
jgi:hypothetical protein